MNAEKNFKILVVDDDDLMREVMSDLLRDTGAEIFEAENGSVAFSMIQTKKPDVVISDVRMPGGDGISLAKNICQIQGPKPGLFMCSGFNDLTPELIKQLNIIELFDKPYDSENVFAKISNYLEKKPSSN